MRNMRPLAAQSRKNAGFAIRGGKKRVGAHLAASVIVTITQRDRGRGERERGRGERREKVVSVASKRLMARDSSR